MEIKRKFFIKYAIWLKIVSSLFAVFDEASDLYYVQNTGWYLPILESYYIYALLFSPTVAECIFIV